MLLQSATECYRSGPMYLNCTCCTCAAHEESFPHYDCSICVNIYFSLLGLEQPTKQF